MLIRKTATYDLKSRPIGKATEFVRECLNACGLKSRDKTKGTLVAEEAISSLVAHAEAGGELRVTVRRLLGNVVVEMSAPGKEYALAENMASASLVEDDELGYEVQETIRNILLRSLTDDLKYRHKAGRNYIRMTLVKSKRTAIYVTLLSLLAAIVVGMALSAAPGSAGDLVDTYLLTPVKTIYLNALKMVVGPVVFFSIVSCISGFGSLSELGRIGGRTFVLYLLTTVLAVGVGIGAFYLFRPGGAALATGAPAAAAAGAASDFSLLDVLVDIVPANFVGPFLENNMTQLIFLAVICGIAVGMIGQYSAVLRQLFDACNELFMQIATLIIRFMPVAIFSSVASLIISVGIGTLLSLVGMFGTFLVGLVVMMGIYCLLLILLGRLDPGPLIRKYAPVMLQVFSMSSSNAALPLNMEFAGKKLGVSRKVYSLSLPLGATLNMDGTCIQLAVFALALAKVYGVTVSGTALLTMAFSIIVLSMGAPGIPGAGVICLSVLLEQIGVPTEAVGLVMGIGPIIGMFLSMSNCLGDMVVTTITARQTGELDMEKYRK